MVEIGQDAPRQELVDGGSPTLVGKRYVVESLGLELLCTKGGTGELTVNGESLTVKRAKALPASD
jgi:hypothetical protein